MKKPRSGPSGPTKTYEERAATGRTPVNVWLNEDELGVLTSLVEAGYARSKRDVIGRMLLELGNQMLCWVPRNESPGPEPAEGSPGDLAARVRAKGARREAIEVASGKTSREGRAAR